LVKTFDGKEMGKHIAYKLFNASKYAYICSPYIDQYYAEAILRMAKRGVIVRVISTGRQAGSFSLGDYFEQEADSIGDNFDYLIFEKSDNNFIHAKMYIIDDKYAIDGSCNLTKAGLWNNVEHLNVYDFEDEVQSIKKSFEKIWRYNGGEDGEAASTQQVEKKNSTKGWRNYRHQKYKRRYYYGFEDEFEDEEDDDEGEEETQESTNRRYNGSRGARYNDRQRYRKTSRDDDDEEQDFEDDEENDEKDDDDDDSF